MLHNIIKWVRPLVMLVVSIKNIKCENKNSSQTLAYMHFL